MSPPKLLSTDFDGTLVFHPDGLRCPGAFAEAVERHKRNSGIWVINTGRSLEHMLEGLRDFRAPFEPDFLIVNERHIHRRENGDWPGWNPWNQICDEVHRELLQTSRPLLEEMAHYARELGGVEIITEDHTPVGIITETEEIMDAMVLFLDRERAHFPGFHFQRNTIYLRFSHEKFSKGSALAELAALLEIGIEEILAIGDNHNDLSMLHSEIAGMVACPENAVQEVKDAVRASGGYLARQPFGKGSAEACVFFSETSSRLRDRGALTT